MLVFSSFSTLGSEVAEEIGLDVSHLIQDNEYIENTSGAQKTRLYVVCGLSEDTPVLTQTRKEISDIAWVQVQDLPTKFNPDVSLVGSSGKPSKLFSVMPYVGTFLRTPDERIENTCILIRYIHKRLIVVLVCQMHICVSSFPGGACIHVLTNTQGD